MLFVVADGNGGMRLGHLFAHARSGVELAGELHESPTLEVVFLAWGGSPHEAGGVLLVEGETA